MAANCIDIIYFRFTLRRTTAGVFQEFAGEQNYFSLITQFLIDYWYIFLIWVALVCILVLFYQKAKRPSFKSNLKNNILFYSISTIALVVMVLLCVAGMRGGFSRTTRPITLNNAGEYVKRPLETTIVQNTPFCIFRTLNKKNLSHLNYFSSNEELSKYYNPVITPKKTEDFRPLNVVIIIWESFAKEYVGALNKDLDGGNYKGYTPFIDSLIGKSLTFTKSYANGRKSIDALPSVISSIPSGNTPYVLTTYSGNNINSIASLLQTKGYSTAFFHGAPNSSMGFKAFVSLAGFEKYYGKTEYNNNDHFDGTWGIRDEEFLQFFANKIGDLKEPFCAGVFTLSSHHPFKLPEQYKDVFPEGPHPMTKVISYTDHSIKHFFETAQKQEWYNNSLFVITADHSNHPLHPEYETSVGQISVPIIYYTPNGELQGLINRVTQQTDIMPTILGYLNYDNSYVAFGQDARNDSIEHYAISCLNGIYHIFFEDYVLLFDGNKTTGLFNLKSDVLMRDDISEKKQDIKEKLELKAKAFLQQYNNRLIDNCLTVSCNKYE
jgi:phosphoglycerol transferase MdoB-like AlkP superfamily enzyme